MTLDNFKTTVEILNNKELNSFYGGDRIDICLLMLETEQEENRI